MLSKPAVLTAAIVVGVLALTGSFQVGRSVSAREARDVEARVESARVSLAEEEERNADLNRSVADLESALEESRSDNQRLREELAVAAAAVTESRSAERGAAEVPADSPATINWDLLADSMADNVELLKRVSIRESSGGDDPLSGPDESAMRTLILRLNEVAAQAREETPYPILDAEMLPRILDVMAGGLLGLDEHQLDRLGGVAEGILDSLAIPDDLSPVESYAFREQLFEQIDGELDDLLTPQQREQWETLQPIWQRVSEGNRRRLTIGLARDDVDARITEGLGRHYGLHPQQRAGLQEMVAEYRRRAAEIVGSEATYDWHSIDGAEYREVRQRFGALQREYDARIIALLDAEQRERLPRTMPLLIRFTPGGTFDRDVDGNRGF